MNTHLVDSIFGWIAIGAAASFAGMIWPFQRGAAGVALNLLLGIGGAVLLALASFLVVPGAHAEPVRLAFAAVGALAALWIAHALWSTRGQEHHRTT
ncbi:MAG TPA: hypothetical protein VK841_06435 [Polyangiaceae bacterium]|jgi:uncharacterized membrane protein YeaQ/YmgE (transglycosylase-associated protein family)|nr:hypothetical protein [Polyangiaceae bacterium]